MLEFAKAASRLDLVSPSGLRAFFDLGAQLAAKGVDVISLGLGDLDLPLPKIIEKAMIAAIKQGHVRYTSNKGIPELRLAIAERYKKTFGLKYAWDEEVLVTVGALEGLLDIMLGLLNPGDRVLVQEPAFGYFQNQALLAGAQVEQIPLGPRFDLDVDRYAEALNQRKTKMIVINSPCNPTGSIASRSKVLELVELARDHNCLVVSDEAYEFLRFDGKSHTCAAEACQDNVIIVNSFSKCFIMTGLRLGYVVAPASIMKSIAQIHQYNTACAAAPIQEAATVALRDPQAMHAFIKRNLAVLNKRRKTAIEHFTKIPGLSLPYEPLGAFYLFPSCKGTGLSGFDFATKVLNEAGVIVIPGDNFGNSFADSVRISYSSAPANRLLEAASRITHLTEN